MALGGPLSNKKQAFTPKSTYLSDVNNQRKPNLEYVPKDEEKTWLAGSVVGYSHAPISLLDLKEIMMGMGFHNCTVTPMRGNMVLLAFPSKTEMDIAINQNLQGLEEWFDLIKPWEEGDSFHSRFVWMKCEGIPLHVWNMSFFSLIGNLSGRFIKSDSFTE